MDKHDPVTRPGGVEMMSVRRDGELHDIATVGPHRVDVPATIPVANEGDPLTIGRPGRPFVTCTVVCDVLPTRSVDIDYMDVQVRKCSERSKRQPGSIRRPTQWAPSRTGDFSQLCAVRAH